MTQSFADPGTPTDGGATRTASVDLTANVSGYTAGMADAAHQTGTMASAVDTLQSKMSGLNKWAGKKLFHFAASDFAVLAGATADAATFQKQLSTLAATSAVTGTSMRGIKNGIDEAFTKFPVARGQVVELVEAITNLGVTSASSIGSLTQTFIKLGAATGEPMTQLAGGLIQLSRLMGTTDATQIGNYANSLLTVSKNAGVSASGVLQFAQSIAPIAHQAGIGTAAVEGISAAFSKAGADGYVATNAFNSIMSDISNSIATGGPDLAKYANLIGVTTAQFKKMDPTNSFVQIFQQIGKQGPQAIAVLNQLGITGQRSQAAIAAITQSGDLQQQIQTALGSQGNQGNLNKGSESAFNNLADSMTNVRNQFTMFGEEIGTTFLTPLTAAANLASKVAHDINGIVKPFAPVIAGLGAVAGSAAGVGSVALSAAGAIGTYALFRNVRRSKAMNAFRAGRTVGTEREDLSPGGPSARYTAGLMGRGESVPFIAGTSIRRRIDQVGLNVGKGSPWRDPTVIRNAMAQGPLNLFRMVSRGNEQWMHGDFSSNGQMPPLAQRWNTWGQSLRGQSLESVVGTGVKGLAGQMGRTAGATAQAGVGLAGRIGNYAWRFAGPSVMGALVGGATGVPGAGRVINATRRSLPTGSVMTEAAGVKEAYARFNTGLIGLTQGFTPVKQGFAATAAASRDLGVALARTAGTATGAMVGQTVRLAGSAAGNALSGLGQLGGMALRAAFSLPGIAAITAGNWAYGKISAGNQRTDDIGKYLNPIQRYNDALGTTTSNLADFNNALTSNSASLSKTTQTIAKAAHFTAADAANAPNKVTNPVWSTVAGGSNVTQTALAVLQSMPISGAGQLKAAENDMAAAGLSKQQINQVTSAYMAQGGPDKVSGLGTGRNLAILGQGVVQQNRRDGSVFDTTTQTVSHISEGAGVVAGAGVGAAMGAAAGSVVPGAGNVIGGAVGGIIGGIGGFFTGRQAGEQISNKIHVDPSERGNQLNAVLLSGIDSQRKSDTTTRGGAFAAQRALASYFTGLGPEVEGAGQGGTFGERSRDALSIALNTMTGGGESDYKKALKGMDLSPHMSQQQQWNALNKALMSNKHGRKYLAGVTSSGGDVNSMAGAQAALVNLSNTTDGSDFNTILRTSGSLGRFAARNQTVQSALGVQQSNPGVQEQTIELLMRQAEGGKGAVGGKGLADGFQGAITALSDFTAKVGDSSGALGQLISQAYQREVAQQKAEQPFQSRATNFSQAVGAYQATQGTLTHAEATGQSSGAIAELAKNRDAAKTDYQQALNDQQSYLQSMYQTAQQYGTQMERAAEDETTQIKRSWRNFHTEMQNANEDYLRQRNRSQADHDEQLRNQVAQSAQSIYSPYQRVQAQYALSAGEVADNLGDQNKRMNDQMAQIRKLRREGLSMQAIQTLDLANPNNAQQTAGLAGTADAKTIGRINRDVAARIRATRNLIQNPYQLAFAEGQTDYQKQLARAAADYQTATGRAAHQQSVALSDMATDYGKTVQRAGQDLTTAMTEVTGHFGSMYAKTMGQIAASVQKFSPAAAGQMRKDLTGLVAQFPFLMGGDPANYNGSTPADTPSATAAEGNHPKPPRMPQVIIGAHAAGGIMTRAHVGLVGEAGPEAVIPLNERGQSFMAALIAKAFGQAMQMVTVAPSTTSTTSVDSSTTFSGPITVQAQDTRAFERDMKAKARLARLTSPVRH